MFQDRQNKQVVLPETFDEAVRSLINGLLEIDPYKRLQGDKLKEHKFFEDINFDELRNPPYDFDSQTSKYFEQFTNKTAFIMSQSTKQQEFTFKFPGFTYEKNE